MSARVNEAREGAREEKANMPMQGFDWSRRLKGCAFAAAAATVLCCGGSNPTLAVPGDSGAPDGSVDTTLFGPDGAAATPGNPGAPTGDDASAPAAPTRACSDANAACTVGFDCCSGTCNGGMCAGSTLGGAPGDGAPATGASCSAPAASCTTGPQCCSGLCEPMTGQAGVVRCLDACRADGVACATAQDCCSLGCFGGVCAAKLCDIVGDTCAADADCCSGVCDPTLHQCQVDLSNSRCRPTGEDCGKGPQSGCCGATKDDDLCDDTGRCGLPPGACRGQKATCTANADCCSGHCDPTGKTCVVLCTAAAGACTTGADCCASSCTNGRCDAPIPPAPPPSPPDAGAPIVPALDAGTAHACDPIGISCTTGATCCSGLCLAGFCDQPVIPR